MKKFLSIILIVTILFTTNTYVSTVSAEETQVSSNIAEIENILSLADTVETKTNPTITTLLSETKQNKRTISQKLLNLFSNNKTVTEVSQLPEYNDGLIASLNTDTTIHDSYVLDNFSTKSVKNLFSNQDIILSGETVIIGETIVALGDIIISAASLDSIQQNINSIYSVHGNITLNVENGTYNGLIYAPEGKVTVKGDSFVLSGNIVAQTTDMNSVDFTCEYNSVINYYCNVLEAIDLGLVQDSNEIYGEFYNLSNYETLVKYAIIANIETLSYNDIDRILIGNRIDLYDADDIISRYGYNFVVADSEMTGHVILGAHSKTSLVDCFSLTRQLRTDTKVYCFQGDEIYYEDMGHYETSNGTMIETEEFEQYKTEKNAYYLNVSGELLESVETANENILLSLETDDAECFDFCLLGSTHYEGTDSDAYGYGGISNIKNYLEDRYGGTATVVNSGKSLTINQSTMYGVSGKYANNCSLVAVAKVLKYYQSQKNKTKIDSSIGDIYDVVEEIALGYGYSDDGGTFPSKINNIEHDAFEHYGYDVDCDGIYVWTFTGQVKKEIDASRPVIMNILRGYYGDHSITVAGYKIYKVKNTEYPMIKVVDGWSYGYRYVDYNAFAFDLATSGFGSFNTASF